MALNPIIILAGLGAAYFLTQNKPKPTTSTSNKNLPPPPSINDENTKDDKEEDENPKDGKLPDLPKPPEDDKPAPVNTDPNNQEKIDLSQYYGTFSQVDGEQPEDPDPSDLWVSETCQSWGIGKKFYGTLPAKIVLDKPENPDKLIGPIEWWSIIGKEFSPAPYYFAHMPKDLAYRSWARVLIQYYTSCGDDIPIRKEFPTFKEYAAALKVYEQKPIGKLYRHIYRAVGNKMLDEWEKQYPEQAKKEDLKYWALWAVRNYPNTSINNQTNQAYWKAFDEDKDAPKKINPNDPKHSEYKDAWLFLNIEVKSILKNIKNYGDAISPLQEKD